MHSELVINCVDSIDQENVTTRRLFEEVVNVTQTLAPTGSCSDGYSDTLLTRCSSRREYVYICEWIDNVVPLPTL